MPSFDSLISNPLKGSPTAQLRYSQLDTTLIFLINLSMYLFQAIFISLMVYNLFQTINKVIHADEEEGVMKFRAGLTNAVFACLGLVLVLSVRYIYKVIFTFLGIPDAQNPYYILPLRPYFSGP